MLIPVEKYPLFNSFEAGLSFFNEPTQALKSVSCSTAIAGAWLKNWGTHMQPTKMWKKDMQTKHKMDRMVINLHDLSLTKRATMQRKTPFWKW